MAPKMELFVKSIFAKSTILTIGMDVVKNFFLSILIPLDIKETELPG